MKEKEIEVARLMLLYDERIQREHIRLTFDSPAGRELASLKGCGDAWIDLIVLLAAIPAVYARAMGQDTDIDTSDPEGLLDVLLNGVRRGCLRAIEGSAKV